MQSQIIHFVDDDEGIRLTVDALLKMEGLKPRVYASGPELLSNISAIKRGCLVTDFNLPEMNGLQLIRAVRAAGSNIPFLLISGYASISMAVEAMKLGAVNILEKPFSPSEFLSSIRATLVESNRRQALADQNMASHDAHDSLTPREKQVLEMVVEGYLTKQIAKSLGISAKTVEVHRSNITKKFGVSSVAQLITRVLTLEPQLRQGMTKLEKATA